MELELEDEVLFLFRDDFELVDFLREVLDLFFACHFGDLVFLLLVKELGVEIFNIAL